MSPTSRLTPRAYDDADADERSVWERILARTSGGGPGGATPDVRPDRLPGPYEAWVRRPALAQKAADLGEEFRFGSVLDPALREIAILQTASHWHANYVFWAHSRLGRAVGVRNDQIDSLRDEHNLPDATPAEHVVQTVTAQLLRTSRIDDATYATARDLLGEAALVDLVAVVGFYCMAAFTINAFEVPLPEGVERIWP